ncbi:MAG: ATP-binding protein [Deltaproteobacteria bacterium]|nr:ATP-binding protein [Deltaproteobacteria bacterium]
MYIKRDLLRTLKDSLRQFPAVMITGPRQAGKTTFLLHELGKSADYISFDDPLERRFAITDPNGFLDRFKDRPVILDEAQYAPEIFQYLKIRIDRERKKNGQWILTGSQQFQLMKNVTESLAGRIAILELLPFGLLEHKGSGSLESFLWNGGYPEPSLFPEKRDLWIRSYIQTYIERDVRQLQNIKDLRAFESFIGLVAAHHGQIFNTAILSRDIGVSLPTIKAWAGVLETSYLCFSLQPYFRNFGKRIVKTPKLYFMDTALVSAITRQPDSKSLLSGAMGGVIFEGMVVSEAVKGFTMKGMKPDIYFWRSHDGLEVDLIIRIGNKIYPIEIKLTSTPTQKHLEPLNKFKAIAGNEAAETGALVCRIEKLAPLPSNNLAIPWRQFPAWLRSKLDKNN